MTIDEQIAEIDKAIAMLVKARKELKEKQRMEDCIDRKQLLDLMSRPLISLDKIRAEIEHVIDYTYDRSR